jgi:hypothetical protein
MRPLLILLATGLMGLPLSAQAYPWMVKHNYTNCASCHIDPSGGGLLSQYGRAQQQFLLESQYAPPNEEGEVNPNTAPFLGLVQPPEWLALGFSFRGGALLTRSANPNSTVSLPASVRPIQMATDLRAGVLAGPLRAGAALGVAVRRAAPATVIGFDPANDGMKLVAREYWAGLSLAEDTVLVRAGRMNLPFGIRSAEHFLWARERTRTDTNDSQQHGLAVGYSGEKLRGEVMLIAGNFQVSPDLYRERGASAYAEYALSPTLTAGVSSLVTASQRDLLRRENTFLRQSHGLFARVGVTESLALMGELDALLSSSAQQSLVLGGVGYLQADLEVVRGLHLLGTLEALRSDQPLQRGVQLGGWLSAGWFFARGLELRVDGIYRQAPVWGAASLRPTSQLLFLSQLHVYL